MQAIAGPVSMIGTSNPNTATPPNTSTQPNQPSIIPDSATSNSTTSNSATSNSTPNTTGSSNAATCAPIAGTPACAGAGNPINVMTGNKYQLETDLPALPGKLGIEIVRHYNSLHMGLGQLGYGWRLGYEIDLHANPRSIQITQADGSHTIFSRSVFNPSDCACQDPAQGHVMIYKTAQGDEYTWFKTDGQQLHFNHMGKLERITSPTGESVHLTRGLKGELLKVTDPQGRSLVMHYADKHKPGFKGIIAIDSPVGRFNYQHNNDLKSAGISNLMQVTYPQASNNPLSRQRERGSDSDDQTIPLSAQLLTKTYHYGETAYIDAHMLPASMNRPQIPHAAHLLTGTSITLPDNASNKTSGNVQSKPNQAQTNQPQTNQAKTMRQRTWIYDHYGRGIVSVHGSPNSRTATQTVKLSYHVVPLNTHKPRATQNNHQNKQNNRNSAEPYPRLTHNGQIGQTTITNSLGQQTTYHYTLIAGEYRLLNILGAGCSECAEPNIIYGYDKLGRQTDLTKVRFTNISPNVSHDDKTHDDKTHQATKPQQKAQPAYQPISTTHTDYDLSGRVVKISRIAYVNGQAQPPQLQVRYAYANTPIFPQLKQAKRAVQEPIQVFNQPSLIAKPSVVAGKEHQWHIRYNPLGQPTQITETGYRPALPTDKTDQPLPIQRHTSYTYRQINGRSLLTQIDGALPNAYQHLKDQHLNSPANSDMTQYHYDKLGQYLTKITAPNNLVTQLEYGREGVPDSAKPNAPHNQLATGGTGRVVQVSNSNGSKTEFAYHPIGNSLTRLTHVYEDGQKQTRSFQYDAQGRLTEQGGGSVADASYRPQMTQGYDDAGHLLWRADALGILKQAGYDSEGRLISSSAQTSRFNQAEHYHYDAQNQLVQVSDNTGSVRNIVYPPSYQRNSQAKQPSAPQNINQTTLKDDFGREVIVRSGHIDIFKQYNAANQLITQTDGHGNTQTYAYDLTGQRIRHTVTPISGISQTTTWRYQQGRLVEIADDQQTERNTYNHYGQLAKRVVSFKLNPAKTASHVTLYQYHPDGSLQSQSLPDGTVLVYQRNGQEQVTALVQQTSPWQLFGWGQQTIVKI